MSHTASLITPSSGPPSVRRRLEVLERRCAELWANEPRSHVDRETALAQLADLEHRIAGLVLKRVAEPDADGLAPAVQRYERELSDLAAQWEAPRAA